MPTYQNDPVISNAQETAVAGDGSVGVTGVGRKWIGVYGETHAPAEVGSAGVWGEGKATGDGVKGVANGPGKAAVCGFQLSTEGDGGPGVYGESTKGWGVRGQGPVGMGGIGSTWIGVYGETNAPAEVGSAGVWGDGKGTGDGVKGVATGPGKAAVCGFQLGGSGPGVFGQGNPAGMFEGDVNVTGKLFVKVDIELANGDCAEEFRVAEPKMAEPGTVMVLGEEETLQCSCHEYDKRVAGVVSGAGAYRPAIVLDRQNDNSERRPLAILGKVYCKVDADYSPIEVGDLLTTSPSPGHAMKANDRDRAFGAVIGKALRRHQRGKGLIPILIALQ